MSTTSRSDRPVPPEAAADWEQTAAQVDRMVALAHEHAEQLQQLTAELAQVEVTERYRDVAVTLAHTGALVRVQILDGGLDVGLIEDAIVIANQRAQQTLRTAVSRLVADRCGADSATAAHFAEQYARTFPDDRGSSR